MPEDFCPDIVSEELDTLVLIYLSYNKVLETRKKGLSILYVYSVTSLTVDSSTSLLPTEIHIFIF